MELIERYWKIVDLSMTPDVAVSFLSFFWKGAHKFDRCVSNHVSISWYFWKRDSQRSIDNWLKPNRRPKLESIWGMSLEKTSVSEPVVDIFYICVYCHDSSSFGILCLIDFEKKSHVNVKSMFKRNITSGRYNPFLGLTIWILVK